MPSPTLPLDTYRKLFRKCILHRVSVDRFESYFHQLLSRSPIPPTAIASTILEPTLTSNASDPLHLQFVSCLVERDIVSLANILVALLQTSAAKSLTTSTTISPEAAYQHLHGRGLLEQDVFLAMALVLRSQKKPRSSESVWAAVQAMSDWMEAVMAASGAGLLSSGDGGVEGIAEATMAQDLASKLRLEALGELIIALGANEQAVKVLSEGSRKEKKLAFRTSLSLFTQYIQVQNPPLANKLEEMRQQYQSQSPKQQRSVLKGGPGETIDGMMMGLGGDAVDFGPVVWTRAHLFIWLDSLLCGCPHVYDEIIIGYLYNRYKEEANVMVADFITAVVDVITNALARNESTSTLFLLRSFLCNKVPLILNRISPSSLASSYAISQTFLRTDVGMLVNLAPSTFEPFSDSSNTSPDMMFGDITIDLRQDFLFACALHGVIGEQEIQGILGELPMSAMPSSGRYDYRMIMSECNVDPSRVDRLLEETEGVEGNSGAVVAALFEVMKKMCDSRETMPLRNICSFLARKPSSIDVMLLFVKPAEILEPLCDLLDTWRYEEDQGEYQPVYEEFGYILLLVLTIIHRYSFTTSDLVFSHPSNNEAFIPQLLHNYSTAQRIEALGHSDRHAQLGGWIKELFEAEGISDGLMMSCQPQEFYLLVPTLFAQSMLAIQRGVLDLDTVNEAFAFLLTPFILPSVIAGLTWLAQHLWSRIDLPSPSLSILTSLIIAHDLPPETAETHRTVVAISARPLDAVLCELLRRPNISPNIKHTTEKLQATLRPHLGFKRTATPTRDEVESWVHTAGTGGLANALTTNYNQLLAWSAGSPPQYTSRLLVTAWKLLGARRVVEIITNEAAKMKAAGHAGVAEDVAAAMLGAYVGEGGRIGFREALQALVAEGADETLVVIMRRVEAAWRPWDGVSGVQQRMEEIRELGDVDLGEMGLGVGVGVGDDMDMLMEHHDFDGMGGLLEMEM